MVGDPLVRTEAVLAAGAFDLSNSESSEFIGRAVAASASDSDAGRRVVDRLSNTEVIAMQATCPVNSVRA